jgi:hypothetical protein
MKMYTLFTATMKNLEENMKERKIERKMQKSTIKLKLYFIVLSFRRAFSDVLFSIHSK